MYNIQTSKCRVLVVFLVVFVPIAIFVYRILCEPKHEAKEKTTVKKHRTILLHTPFFQYPNWDFPAQTNGPEFLRSINCPVTNCVFTSNHSYFRSFDLYDAIMFHYGDSVEPAYCPENAGQAFVFFMMESPAYTLGKVCAKDDYYTFTMTYRLDSDVLAGYGQITDARSGETVAPKPAPSKIDWRSLDMTFSPLEIATLQHITRNKKKMAAWFVSHCNALSKRDEVAKALAKYINVDIYGDCGSMSCPRNSDKCDKMLDDDYKFYFSFENSLCVDYVTEKFYDALKRYVVPVVLGGANYSLFAPPHSYINVDDFKTAEDLANYLKYLDNNPNEYIKYFWWKKHYKVENMYKWRYCELCKKLNQPEALHPKRFLNLDWWHNNTCYYNPKIKFV